MKTSEHNMARCHKRKRNIAFLGTRPLGSRCLQYLLTIPHVNIVAVATPPKDYRGWWSGQVPEVYELAKKNHIKILKKEDELLQYEFDLGISVQYTNILKPHVLSHPRNGFINLHNAPLPYYRGRNGYAHAILNREKRFGATLHYMTEKVDEGPVIKIKWCDILPDMTARELAYRVEDLAFQLFTEIIPKFLIRKRLKAVPQKKIIEKEMISPKFYFKNSLAGREKVDLSWDAETIYDHIRAFEFPPFSPAYMELPNHKKIFLTIKNPFRDNNISKK